VSPPVRPAIIYLPPSEPEIMVAYHDLPRVAPDLPRPSRRRDLITVLVVIGVLMVAALALLLPMLAGCGR